VSKEWFFRLLIICYPLLIAASWFRNHPRPWWDI